MHKSDTGAAQACSVPNDMALQLWKKYASLSLSESSSVASVLDKVSHLQDVVGRLLISALVKLRGIDSVLLVRHSHLIGGCPLLCMQPSEVRPPTKLYTTVLETCLLEKSVLHMDI